MTKKSGSVWSPCSKCNQKTIHSIKCIHTEDGGDDYHCAIYYMVIQCRGCENTSFRYVFRDYENAFPISDDEWDVPETIETYPKFLKNHRELIGAHHIPDIVQQVYEESLIAIKEDARILAGLGLRGTIEAICNDCKITGKNLEIRISRLAAQGLISNRDAERLQSIRFLGNDAAHDIKKPAHSQLDIALRIIEHLITTVYILDAEAKGKLETIVTDFIEFEKLLESRLKNFSMGDEYPLAKILDKDVRRLHGQLSQLESKLVHEIKSGNYKRLSLGKIDNFSSYPTKLQHFVVK